jgi:hypothetical protein
MIWCRAAQSNFPWMGTLFLACFQDFGFKSYKYRGSKEVQQSEMQFPALLKDLLR